MKPTELARRYGQSIWLDFISRGLILSGGSKRPIEQDHVIRGATNPTLLRKPSMTGMITMVTSTVFAPPNRRLRHMRCMRDERRRCTHGGRCPTRRPFADARLVADL